MGGLILAGERTEGHHHTRPDFLGTTVATTRQFGIAQEVLSVEQLTLARRMGAGVFTGGRVLRLEPFSLARFAKR